MFWLVVENWPLLDEGVAKLVFLGHFDDNENDDIEVFGPKMTINLSSICLVLFAMAHRRVSREKMAIFIAQASLLCFVTVGIDCGQKSLPRLTGSFGTKMVDCCKSNATTARLKGLA